MSWKTMKRKRDAQQEFLMSLMKAITSMLKVCGSTLSNWTSVWITKWFYIYGYYYYPWHKTCERYTVGTRFTKCTELHKLGILLRHPTHENNRGGRSIPSIPGLSNCRPFNVFVLNLRLPFWGLGHRNWWHDTTESLEQVVDF